MAWAYGGLQLQPKNFPGQVEIIDLRSLSPCDDELIYTSVRKHNKVIVLTEETLRNSFAESLAGRISKECFTSLDAPVHCLGSADLPAVPLNKGQEAYMLPSSQKTCSIDSNSLGLLMHVMNRKKVKIGGVPEHFNYPWHAAMKKGLFSEYGLEVEWHDIKGGSGAMCQLLDQGDLDMALVLTEGIVKHIVQGGMARIVQQYVKSPLIWGVHASKEFALQRNWETG